METKTYAAIRVRQTDKSGHLVLFAAPAVEIDDWSGIPQRERLDDDDEAVGFQREENKNRLKELARFFSDKRNIVQNPLLCASRDNEKVLFVEAADASGDENVVPGSLTIQWDDLDSHSLLSLLKQVKASLEERVPSLSGKAVEESTLNALRIRISEALPELTYTPDGGEDGADESDLEDAPAGIDDSSGDDPTSALFTGETHIVDFWEAVAARVELLEELKPEFNPEIFLGFSKDAMKAYLQPVVIVDGQHRLKGALLAAADALDSEEIRAEIDEGIHNGEDPDEIERRLRRREARSLPVSLLMETSPSEHVFQFVVVNQKATPIGKALLGTIVSTSLSSNELEEVSLRLERAGIPLEDSKAIAYMTRAEGSPFKNLVERGITKEDGDLLKWSVLNSLIKIFRYLQGGRLYHQRNDYADKWRRNNLDASQIVASRPPDLTPFDYWSSAEGPWREVFIAFWSAVRDRLAVVDDPDAANFWGRPRRSNIFNKVSLTILAADYFKYITSLNLPIDMVDDVHSQVDDWLDGVKDSYFNRDWKLEGVKKDAPGTRAQWADLWTTYREDPLRAPAVSQYRLSKA